ncbi:MAG: 1-deoxy-D-xylulose-5-phosphate reductoisomerase [Alphaproteobacteria bacterium]
MHGTTRRITILGATGSVGENTLRLIAAGEPGAFDVVALTANVNAKALAAAAIRVNARLAVVAQEDRLGELREALAGTQIEAAAGQAAIVAAASEPADWVMSAIVGTAGLAPTLAAIRQGATVALANKETLVCAGSLAIEEVKAAGATLLPVDSEHNAIFQVLDIRRPETISRLILTASGGPFRTATYEQMKSATPAQAVAHPNWDMGAKISVDSATMMNKGLEIIEASFLFDQPSEKIDVLVHPQSIIHSMVEYLDGSVLAQLGTPDMRTPIANALAWPTRMAVDAPKLDLTAIDALTFEEPDDTRFPALSLARSALKAGGSAPPVFNAANEIAVAAFLDGKLGFLEIVDVVASALENHDHRNIRSMDDAIAIDVEARRTTAELIDRRTVA